MKCFIAFVLSVFSLNSFANTHHLPLIFNTGNKTHTLVNAMPSTVATIQGHDFPLLLDTGADQTGIDLSADALHHIKVIYTEKKECFVSMDGTHCEKAYLIPEITIAGFVLKNVPGALMPTLWGNTHHGFVESDASKTGVIGLKVLSQFNILLDYPNHQATLFQLTDSPSCSKWTTIPFTVDHAISTSAVINGIHVKLGWDTGTIPSLINQTVTKHTVACPETQYYGNKATCRMVYAEDFNIAGVRLPSIPFLVQPFGKKIPYDGFVGSNFFAAHLVFFDFKDHLIKYS